MSYVAWLRSRLGPRKVILVYATVILRDTQGRVLLQRRADLPVWGFPGGVLEPGESLETCARRELKEETGLEAGTLAFVGLYTSPRYDVAYPNGDEAQQFTVCLTSSVGGGQMCIDGDEATEQHFFPPGLLPWDEIPGWYRQMWSDVAGGRRACFDPPETATPDGPAMTDLLPGEPMLLAPVVMAVVRSPEGRILVRETKPGLRFPLAPARLGQSASETAARLATGLVGSRLEPARLLGVFSRPGNPATGSGHIAQPIAAVFLMNAPASAEHRSDGRWVHPTALDERGAQVGWLAPDGEPFLA